MGVGGTGVGGIGVGVLVGVAVGGIGVLVGFRQLSILGVLLSDTQT